MCVCKHLFRRQYDNMPISQNISARYYPLATDPAGLRLLTRFIITGMSFVLQNPPQILSQSSWLPHNNHATITPVGTFGLVFWYRSMQAPALGKTISVFSPSAAYIAASATREEVSFCFQIDLKTVYPPVDTVFIPPLILLLSQILLILLLRQILNFPSPTPTLQFP